MRGYRLTRRGKVVLTMFVMIICLVSPLFFKGNAIASYEQEVLLQNSSFVGKPDIFYDDLSYSYEKKLIAEDISKINMYDTFHDNGLSADVLNIRIEDIKNYDEKIAFLTFDDGPSENVTPLVLNILDEYNIKATFFVLGYMCKKNGYLLKELASKGHAIGIHSYSHEDYKLLRDKDSFINEIQMTEDLIKENLGENFTTRLFRFPGGSFEDYKQKYIETLHDMGYIEVDWNALTGDSEYVNPKPEKLIENLKRTTLHKDKIIVLMHDAPSKVVTADILPDVIEYLKSNGYAFALLK